MKAYDMRGFCDCGGLIVDMRGNETEPHEIECLDCGKQFTLAGNTNNTITPERKQAYTDYLKGG